MAGTELSKLTETELLEMFQRIVSAPGSLTHIQTQEIWHITMELKRRARARARGDAERDAKLPQASTDRKD